MFKALFLSFTEDLLRGISGPLGIRLRRLYYRRRLKSCGERLNIEAGVHITNPSWVSIGSDVWLDKNTILIAGAPKQGGQVNVKSNNDVSVEHGEIVIGDGSHIGIGAIIQGHGGVEIGKDFTASPHSKIYSYSNDYLKCRNGTINRSGYKQHYILTPVFIGSNVWIGINSVIVGHSIGDNCFIKPGVIMAKNIPENSIFGESKSHQVITRFFSD